MKQCALHTSAHAHTVCWHTQQHRDRFIKFIHYIYMFGNAGRAADRGDCANANFYVFWRNFVISWNVDVAEFPQILAANLRVRVNFRECMHKLQAYGCANPLGCRWQCLCVVTLLCCHFKSVEWIKSAHTHRGWNDRVGAFEWPHECVANSGKKWKGDETIFARYLQSLSGEIIV